MTLQAINLTPTSVLTGTVVSLALVKEALRLPSDLSDEDNFLTNAINAAESFIDRVCNVHLRSRPVSGILAYFSAIGLAGSTYYAGLRSNVYPLTAISFSYKNLANEDTAISGSNVSIINSGLLPEILVKDANIVNENLYPDYPYPITITGTAGYTQLPSEAQQAIFTLVGYQYQNRELVLSADMASALFQNPHILALQRRPY